MKQYFKKTISFKILKSFSNASSIKLGGGFILIFYISSLALLSSCQLVDNRIQGYYADSPSNLIPEPVQIFGKFADSGVGGINPIVEADFNGDGYLDVLAPAQTENGNVGAIYVYSGLDNSLLYSYSGAVDDSYFGPSSVVDDLDGDGVKDILVNSSFPFNKGRMTAISGATGVNIFTSDDSEIWFGQYNFVVEDLNLDVTPDIFTSSIGASTNRGMIWAIDGSDGTIIWSKTGSSIGAFMAITELWGDYNSDGATDILTSNDGIITILSGLDGATLKSCPTPYPGGLISVSDADTDGKRDFMVSHQMDSSGRGKVTMISSDDCSVIASRAGENAGDRFGKSLIKLNDTNGDGLDDYVVFADKFDSDRAKAYLISGADASVLYSVLGSAQGVRLFAHYEALSDYDGDGVLDWAAYEVNPIGDIGKYYVYSGKTGVLLYTFTNPDGIDWQRYINASTDFDGDGLNEFIFVSSAYDSLRGKIYIYSGDGTFLSSVEGENQGDYLGGHYTVGVPICDINSDGKYDVILKAPESDGGRGMFKIHSTLFD